MTFTALENTPLHAHKLILSLIAGAITELAALIFDIIMQDRRFLCRQVADKLDVSLD